jgi:hypothetical protein
MALGACAQFRITSFARVPMVPAQMFQRVVVSFAETGAVLVIRKSYSSAYVELQGAGYNGVVPPAQCSLLSGFLSDVCECTLQR